MWDEETVEIAQTDDMALNQHDREWLEIRIREALREQFSRRLARVQQWVPTAAIVAVILFAALQWNAYTVFKTRTEDELANIKASLLDLRASRSPARVLKEIGALDPKVFAKALPALRTVAETPIGDVKPSQDVLLQVAAKLRNTPETSQGYWPTVLRFIQFASAAGEVSSKVPPHGAPNLLLSDSLIGRNTFSPNALEDRVIVLDGGAIDSVTFKRDRVVFTDRPVAMRNVSFVDCVFEFPVTDDPGPYLQRASRQLLASDMKSVTAL